MKPSGIAEATYKIDYSKAMQPVFDLPEGTYGSNIKVTLTTTTEGAKIYYTLDGTDPSETSTLYSGTIELSGEGSKTIKAIAVKEKMKTSDISSSTYIIDYNANKVWKQISAGEKFTCGLKTDGTLWCWGSNAYGQLGDGTTVGKKSPTKITESTDWASVSAGNNYTCGSKENGTLLCWGYNDYGQLGNGEISYKGTSKNSNFDTCHPCEGRDPVLGNIYKYWIPPPRRTGMTTKRASSRFLEVPINQSQLK